MNLVCRACGSPLETTMVDLGMHPLCETFLTEDQIEEMEPFYPLHVRVCGECFLAQIGEFVPPEQIFDDYAYYSSYSEAWLRHAEEYVAMMIERFDLDTSSKVIEIASNDGYLLQYFLASGLDVLGVEPASNVADAAMARGIPTRVEFFNESSALRMVSEGRHADVLLGNNVMAHAPDINGFVAGIPIVLAADGVATFEFPHILRLLEGNQFDTIYHEHWSYLSLGTIKRILESHGLKVFDVEELWTHGGSIRVYVAHAGDDSKPTSARVAVLLELEREAGLFELSTYERFGEKVEMTKRRLLSLLIEAKDEGKSIAVYGAAGKGNTLLNYCGIGPDFIDYACDKNPYKHGRFTPGTHIPIFGPERIRETRPDFILVLPWNIKDEIVEQLAYVSEWGGKFIVPIPEAHVIEGGSV